MLALAIVALAALAPPTEPASLAPVAFLSGAWLGEEAGEVHEETWTPERAGSMNGMYRWIDKGKPRMSELLSLSAEDSGPVLRIRHFDGAFAPWEEKDKPIILRLRESSATPPRAVFENTDPANRLERLTYELADPSTLRASLAFRQGSGREPIGIVMKRAATPPEAPRAAATPSPTPLSPERSAAAYEKIKSLAGDWEGKSTKGWTERISYRVMAGGSCVMDASFDAHPGEMMASMIHPDGGRLLLTHYCAAKNQPRLVATGLSDDGSTLTFEFLDGTNMASRDKGHMDQLVIHFIDADHFTKHWTWYQNGKADWMEEIEHRRVGAVGPAGK